MNNSTDWSLYEQFDGKSGDVIDLGEKSFSEQEIIDYARLNDPLPFHLSVEDAKRSFFGKLVCSGGQAFNFFYVNRWIPIMGSTIVGGLGINNWSFIEPTGADERIYAKVFCKNIRHSKSNPRLSIAVWLFEFHNNSGTLVQSLEIKILHKRK
ncbi:MAG: hypothetical protein CMP59_06260 [Flavobacteriales bacterium]|mgnify:FL=1|nr:hypothetical protein [Flavobacteriales bacterium]